MTKVKNKKLTAKEKEIIRAFVFETSKLFEKLQDCTTYNSLIDLNKVIDSKLDKSKAIEAFGRLQDKVKKEMGG